MTSSLVIESLKSIEVNQQDSVTVWQVNMIIIGLWLIGTRHRGPSQPLHSVGRFDISWIWNVFFCSPVCEATFVDTEVLSGVQLGGYVTEGLDWVLRSDIFTQV